MEWFTQPGEPEPAAVQRGIPGAVRAGAGPPQPVNHGGGGQEKLAKLADEGRPDGEFAFVVHGTMADPR